MTIRIGHEDFPVTLGNVVVEFSFSLSFEQSAMVLYVILNGFSEPLVNSAQSKLEVTFPPPAEVT